MAEFSKPGYLTYNGVPLTQTGEISFQASSDDKAVKTLLLGLAGYSDGAQLVDIDFKSAIPLAGYERDFTAVCLSHQTVDFVFKIAGVISTARGRIMTATTSTSTESPNALDVKFQGFVLARTAG